MNIKTENLFLIASLVLVALLLSGFIPTIYGDNLPHKTRNIQYVVQTGETFWEIAERHYPEGKEIRPFAEFMHDQRIRNGFKVGNNRKFLQVGETLDIEIKEKFKEDEKR